MNGRGTSEDAIHLARHARELMAKSDSLLHKAAGLLQRNFRRNLVRFLKTEVKVGLTFATINSQMPDGATRQRNRTQARLAYNSARRRVKSVHLAETDRADILRGLAELRAALERLGESFEAAD